MLSGFRLVLQSSFPDGVAFDPFSLQQDGLAASEVDVGRCEVGQATLPDLARSRRPVEAPTNDDVIDVLAFQDCRCARGVAWHTTVFAQWDGTATLLNGDASYVNRGLHVFTLGWGRVYALEEFQDSQAAARALAAQAAAGLEEAVAEQIAS